MLQAKMSINFETLPPEVVLRVLSYLSIPDLFSLTRTSHLLRQLACDPILHVQRLHLATHTLSISLPQRPAIETLRPPRAAIYLNRTHVLSRAVSRSLIKVRLNHSLSNRPPATLLVDRAILFRECTSYSSPISPALIQSHRAVLKQRLRSGLGKKLERRPSLTSLVSLNILPEECASRSISPALVARRRQVIKESLKDGLRAWVEGRAVLAQKRKAVELDAAERITVKNLVKRYTSRRAGSDPEDTRQDLQSRERRKLQVRWGRGAELAARREHDERRRATGACSQPTRAKVLNLTRFWENLGGATAV
jgi:hypothetical protein